LDEVIKIKIEHEISRIDKLLSDVNPLLNLCKTKEQMVNNIENIWQIIKKNFRNFIENN